MVEFPCYGNAIQPRVFAPGSLHDQQRVHEQVNQLWRRIKHCCYGANEVGWGSAGIDVQIITFCDQDHAG